MAAFRRVAALAWKINLGPAAKRQLAGGGKARRCAAAAAATAAGAAALYCGYGARRRQSISGFLRSIPVVEAKETVGNKQNDALFRGVMLPVFPPTIPLEYIAL